MENRRVYPREEWRVCVTRSKNLNFERFRFLQLGQTFQTSKVKTFRFLVISPNQRKLHFLAACFVRVFFHPFSNSLVEPARRVRKDVQSPKLGGCR